MDVEITPEPTAAERQAILRALELEQEEDEPPAPWRRAGLEPDQAARSASGVSTGRLTRVAGQAGNPRGRRRKAAP